jgi:hypothetical protein
MDVMKSVILMMLGFVYFTETDVTIAERYGVH